MKVLLNIIWLVLSGLWLAIGYAIAGVIACILIITIPFGLQAFKLANYSLWPFGRTIVNRPDAGGAEIVRSDDLMAVLREYRTRTGEPVETITVPDSHGARPRAGQ
jgi:uncharacterized membrane protein YccF (DUF307 family)